MRDKYRDETMYSSQSIIIEVNDKKSARFTTTLLSLLLRMQNAFILFLLTYTLPQHIRCVNVDKCTLAV